MNQRKLVITQNLESPFKERLHSILPDWEIVFGRDRSIWNDHISDAEVIAGWKKEMTDLLSQNKGALKWVQTWTAGVNQLPLHTLQEKGVHVTSANGVHTYPISETIFALMLGLTRKIHAYVRNQQTKTWHHENMKLEIHGKTIGIIGVGSIGQETAKIAKAFSMNVLGIRHSGKSAPFVDEMYSPQQLDDILPKCDYVVVTLPLTSETKQMFGEKQFRSMKRSAFFINIGRGDIVVEPDLISALQKQEIAGAGLDVFEKEPLSEESPLWNFDNVIITPHTAGSTEHYDKRVIEDIFIPNLENYVNNDPLTINVVDFNKGY